MLMLVQPFVLYHRPSNENMNSENSISATSPGYSEPRGHLLPNNPCYPCNFHATVDGDTHIRFLNKSIKITACDRFPLLPLHANRTPADLFRPASTMEEKRKLQWRRGRDGIVQYPHLFFAALALALVVADPFGLSPLAGVDYRPVKHELAPYAEVMGSWPRDNASRLRRGRLEFVGEVFGPESIEFDREGRGPYAGLADGRVVRWMGEEAGWETFAVMNPEW